MMLKYHIDNFRRVIYVGIMIVGGKENIVGGWLIGEMGALKTIFEF